MYQAAFSGFSVDDQAKAKQFYTEVVDLKLIDESMGLRFELPGGSGEVFIYSKEDHKPATYTNLNFVVADIEKAVADLKSKGAKFEHYEGITDDQNIARGKANHRGPDIAWFKDPAGNTLAVLCN